MANCTYFIIVKVECRIYNLVLINKEKIVRRICSVPVINVKLDESLYTLTSCHYKIYLDNCLRGNNLHKFQQTRLINKKKTYTRTKNKCDSTYPQVVFIDTFLCKRTY